MPPLPEYEILEFMSKMGITLLDYKLFYSWRNGLSDTARNLHHTTRIMVHGNFVPVSSGYLKFLETREDDYWTTSQILIADSFEGERLFLETDPSSSNYGMILSLVPYGNHAGTPIPIYDNVEAMINSLITMYDRGALFYDVEEDYLEIDFDKVAEICIPRNPRSKYWEGW